MLTLQNHVHQVARIQRTEIVPRVMPGFIKRGRALVFQEVQQVARSGHPPCKFHSMFGTFSLFKELTSRYTAMALVALDPYVPTLNRQRSNPHKYPIFFELFFQSKNRETSLICNTF